MKIHLWLFGIAMAVPATPTQAQTQAMQSLTALEQLLASAPALQGSIVEQQIAEEKHTLALSELAPKLFISGTAATSVDPVRAERYNIEQSQSGALLNRTQTVLTPEQDRYGRYGAVVGVRIPLFGSRDALAQNAFIAETGIAAAKARQQVVQLEMLKALRYAYIELYFNQAQSGLAKAYLESEPSTLKVLDSRRKANLLLDAEYKSMQTGFFSARHDLAGAKTALTEGAAKINHLTGQNLENSEIEAPALPSVCHIPTIEGSEQPSHASLRLQALNLEHKRRALAMTGSRFADSAFTISQGVQRYGSGRSGNGTAVSIDVQFPIGGPDRGEAAKRLALAELEKARLEFDAQKTQFTRAIQQVAGEIAVRKEQVALLRQRVEATREADRVARLRTAQPQSDAVSQLVRSRQALYEAYHAQFDGEMQLSKAQTDLAGLGECEADRQSRSHFLSEVKPLLSSVLIPTHLLPVHDTAFRKLKDGASHEN